MSPSRRLAGSAWADALARLCDPHTVHTVIGIESQIAVGAHKHRVVCTLGLPRRGTPQGRVVQVPGLLSFCQPKGTWHDVQTEPRRSVGRWYKSTTIDYVRACEYETPGAAVHPFDIAYTYGFSIEDAARYVSQTIYGRIAEIIEPVEWMATRMLRPIDRYAVLEHQRQTFLLGKITESGGETVYHKWLDEPDIRAYTPPVQIRCWTARWGTRH